MGQVREPYGPSGGHTVHHPHIPFLPYLEAGTHRPVQNVALPLGLRPAGLLDQVRDPMQHRGQPFSGQGRDDLGIRDPSAGLGRLGQVPFVDHHQPGTMSQVGGEGLNLVDQDLELGVHRKLLER